MTLQFWILEEQQKRSSYENKHPHNFSKEKYDKIVKKIATLLKKIKELLWYFISIFCQILFITHQIDRNMQFDNTNFSGPFFLNTSCWYLKWNHSMFSKISKSSDVLNNNFLIIYTFFFTNHNIQIKVLTSFFPSVENRLQS
jgi:hypothetical protein